MNSSFNKKGSFFQSGGPKNLVIVAIIFVASLFVMTRLSDLSEEIEAIDYSTLIHRIKAKQVESVNINGQDVTGVLVDKKRFESVIPLQDQSIWSLVQENDVKTRVAHQEGQYTFTYFFVMMAIFIAIALLWHFIKQSKNSGGNGGSGIFSMGKSRAKMFMPSSIKENFQSVAGAQEAKEELADIIDFLKNPKKFTRLGAKVTRGVLLVGEPGNGKTLLARAVAGEANCPFFSISGSDFIEVFVGVGASRVRDLFAQARKNAPCIIFIDEIDAVGRHRGSGQGGGNDEREQTLNQLLTEMDGFETHQDPVIVIAATNRPDVLDKALLRPGRFDRQVQVPYPDLVSREEILQVHIKNVKIDSSIDLGKIARGTPGFSGADLANLVNEAAIVASKRNAPEISMSDFEEARDKVMLGKEVKTMHQTELDKKMTAYHESGHALVTLLMPDLMDPLHKLTIVPRGRALGVTHTLPEREKPSTTKREMEARIMMALGGKVAEQIVFGEMTTGAASDLRNVSSIARRMVCLFGMDESVGSLVYTQDYSDYRYSEKTAELIDNAVRAIVSACDQRTQDLLSSHRDMLDKLALELLDKETLYASEVYELLGLPPREDFRLVK